MGAIFCEGGIRYVMLYLKSCRDKADNMWVSNSEMVVWVRQIRGLG